MTSKSPTARPLASYRRRKGNGYKLGPRPIQPTPPEAIWLTSGQVRRRYGGKSYMWLWRKVQNDPDFPQPRYDGRIQNFSVAELDAYDQFLLSKLASEPTRKRKAAGGES